MPSLQVKPGYSPSLVQSISLQPYVFDMQCGMTSFTETKSRVDYVINSDGRIRYGEFSSHTETNSWFSGKTKTFKHNPEQYAKSNIVFVYDRNEKMQLMLSDDTIPYTGAIDSELNEAVTIELEVMASDPMTEYIENEGRLVTKDEEGNFREFIIRSVEDEFSDDGLTKVVEGEGSEYELIDEWLEGYTESNVSFETALEAVLQGTRFEIGEMDKFSRKQSVDLKHMAVREAVNKLIEQWDADVQYRVDVRGNRVGKRYIDIFEERGEDIGRRFEAGKDIKSATRELDSSEIKTALYGAGASDDEGKRLTFSEIEWKKSEGDPVDKPEGDTFVGDPDALEQWGYEDGRRHRFGGYDGQEEDAATLLLNTWNELQKQKELKDTYETDVVNLGEILDYPHEQVRLGDKVRVVINDMNPSLNSMASIVEYKHNLNDRKLSEVTIGHFRAKVNTDERAHETERDHNNKRGEWDKKPDKVRNELKDEIDEALDEADKRIEKAKENLEESMDKIEDSKTNLDDVQKEIDDSRGNHHDYVGNFDGDIAADNLVLRGKLKGEGAEITGTIEAKELVLQDAHIEKGKIQEAEIKNATITEDLYGEDATFHGKVLADQIKGSEIEGLRLSTGISNAKYTKIEEEKITLVDDQAYDDKEKLTIGYRDENNSSTQKPYMIWGYGKSNGRSKMVMEKGEEHFYMRYDASPGESRLEYNYSGSVTLEATNVLNLKSAKSIEANNKIYADDFKSNSTRDIKKDIKEFDDNATDIIADTPVYEYKLKKNDTEMVGFMADEAPAISDGAGVSHYTAVALAWKAITELNERVAELEEA